MPTLGALESCCIPCLEGGTAVLPPPSLKPLPAPAPAPLQTPCFSPAPSAPSAPSKACITGSTPASLALSWAALPPPSCQKNLSLSEGKTQPRGLSGPQSQHLSQSPFHVTGAPDPLRGTLLSESSNSHHSDPLPGQPTAVPALRSRHTPTAHVTHKNVTVLLPVITAGLFFV